MIDIFVQHLFLFVASCHHSSQRWHSCKSGRLNRRLNRGYIKFVARRLVTFPSQPVQQLSFYSSSRTAMAAASWSGSRGVAGVRATTGLFLVFTLLCLVCLSSSVTQKDELEEMRQKLQASQRKMDSLKAQYKSKLATTPELMREFRSLVDPLIVFLKKASTECPVFLPLERMVENTKSFMEETNERSEELALKIETSDKQLGYHQKLIKFLEEQETEL